MDLQRLAELRARLKTARVSFEEFRCRDSTISDAHLWLPDTEIDENTTASRTRLIIADSVYRTNVATRVFLMWKSLAGDRLNARRVRDTADTTAAHSHYRDQLVRTAWTKWRTLMITRSLMVYTDRRVLKSCLARWRRVANRAATARMLAQRRAVAFVEASATCALVTRRRTMAAAFYIWRTVVSRRISARVAQRELRFTNLSVAEATVASRHRQLVVATIFNAWRHAAVQRSIERSSSQRAVAVLFARWRLATSAIRADRRTAERRVAAVAAAAIHTSTATRAQLLRKTYMCWVRAFRDSVGRRRAAAMAAVARVRAAAAATAPPAGAAKSITATAARRVSVASVPTVTPANPGSLVSSVVECPPPPVSIVDAVCGNDETARAHLESLTERLARRVEQLTGVVVPGANNPCRAAAAAAAITGHPTRAAAASDSDATYCPSGPQHASTAVPMAVYPSPTPPIPRGVLSEVSAAREAAQARDPPPAEAMDPPPAREVGPTLLPSWAHTLRRRCRSPPLPAIGDERVASGSADGEGRDALTRDAESVASPSPLPGGCGPPIGRCPVDRSAISGGAAEYGARLHAALAGNVHADADQLRERTREMIAALRAALTAHGDVSFAASGSVSLSLNDSCGS